MNWERKAIGFLRMEITVSFLTTMEDYQNMRLDLAKLGVAGWERISMKGLGYLAVVSGIAGAVLKGGKLSSWIAWAVLLLTGLFCLFYYDRIFSYLIIRRALKEYESLKEKLYAQTIRITGEGIEISDIRQECRYPFSIFYRCVRTEHLFVFYLGIGMTRAVPVRLLTAEEQAALDKFLSETMGESYHKVGI